MIIKKLRQKCQYVNFDKNRPILMTRKIYFYFQAIKRRASIECIKKRFSSKRRTIKSQRLEARRYWLIKLHELNSPKHSSIIIIIASCNFAITHNTVEQ